LQTPSEEEKSLVILAAAYLGSARLIDNLRVELA
jgi:pantoate--beta-alanine ligase